MYCMKCGTTLPENIEFCSKCGAKQNLSADPIHDGKAESERVPKQNSPEANRNPEMNPDNLAKNKKKRGISVKVVLLICATILVVGFFGAVFLSDSSTDEKINESISLVKQSYLGEYTDVSLESVLTAKAEALGMTLQWNGGTLGEDEQLGVSAILGEELTLQFVMLDDQCFVLAGMDGTMLSGVERVYTTGMELLNAIYTEYYLTSGMDFTTVSEKLEAINAGSVQCGAPPEYQGNRRTMYTEIAQKRELNLTDYQLMLTNDQFFASVLAGES